MIAVRVSHRARAASHQPTKHPPRSAAFTCRNDSAGARLRQLNKGIRK
jgi:hypothetical protein